MNWITRWFRRSSLQPPGRYLMMQVPLAEGRRLLKDRKTRTAVGYPVFWWTDPEFGEQFWPLPIGNIEIRADGAARFFVVHP